jgi:hypothetical protein
VIRTTSILFALLLSLTVMVHAQTGAPEDLTAVIDHNGNVVLNWGTPVGQVPYAFEIWRGEIAPNQVVAQIYDPTARQFTDYRVSVGANYKYVVVAVYSGNRYVSSNLVSIDVIPPATGLKIVSTPTTTALVGSEYVYAPSVDAASPDEIAYMLINEPAGMSMINIVGGAYISWVPTKVGRYKITLVATNVYTQERDVQEYYITVADNPGTVRGFVRTYNSIPLPGAEVRLFQMANGRSLDYSTFTDKDGNFVLNNVQAGRIYAYAVSPDSNYKSEYYINQQSIEKAVGQDLKPGGTVLFEFHLLAKNGSPGVVYGRVVAANNVGIQGARVSFYRKDRFIHIGDTASINRLLLDAPIGWRSSIVDKVVFTDFKGDFSVTLPVGEHYYTVVEKENYLASFIADETNAMEAKAIRVANGSTTLQYELTSSAPTDNKIYGKVSSKNTGVSKQATIVLIDTEMKHGAGGGHTYRKYQSVVTDSNGVFRFDNLADSPPSALLAIPMDTRLAPQYYHSNGGRSNFMESEELTPYGTIQGIDFELQETVRNGIGVFFGQVILREGANRIPLPGTLVFAERASTGEVVGYAISDSTGWYSIMGLEQDEYLLYADNPQYTYHIVYSPAKPTRGMPVSLNYLSSGDPSRKSDVNFYIDDLRTVVGINPDLVPQTATLYQNYPNPFNPSTTIRYAVPQRQHVALRVINALGEEVALLVDEFVEGGLHAADFQADNLPSGMYFYQLQTDTGIVTKPMTLTK